MDLLPQRLSKIVTRSILGTPSTNLDLVVRNIQGSFQCYPRPRSQQFNGRALLFYHVLKHMVEPVKAFREMNITGEIAFKNNDYVGTPWRKGNTEDIAAVERHVAFQIGIFSDPVYTTGDGPQIVKDTLPPDFLPRFTEGEQKDLLSSADFYATNAYRTFFNAAPLDGLDACVNNTAHPNWPTCNIQVAYTSPSQTQAGQ
ncbi:hypothetical protein BT96DRAFT_1035873 [Gymnopus androsaceus JB14]|uniref:Uncharacterized protein n=1 Tax=Gymnopus androsaceus JB14 TaxID=1447944 RepID=A0A6A4GCW2_9AGAR|nr:hypothetical protein BT96DRAFT_1035873 [Gymnopus androsaceus JB14]